MFTHEAQRTIDRMITEHDCLAALVPNATRVFEGVLAAIRDTVGVDRLVRTVSGLFADTGVAVTRYHVADEDETDEDARTLLGGIAARLVENGMDAGAIDSRIARDRRPLDAIREAADVFDALVMGESDPSLATFVFVVRAAQVADRFLGPVLAVQREPPREDEG